MKPTKFLFSVLMAIVMMAMCPMKMWAQNVASVTIGETTTSYADIQEALTAALEAESATMTMLADVTFSGGNSLIFTKGNVTFDLNGHSITGSYSEVVKVYGGTLTIIDNSEEQTGLLQNNVYAIWAYSGSLTIHAGTFRGNTQYALNVIDANVKLYGGHFISTQRSGVYTQFNRSALATGYSYYNTTTGAELTDRQGPILNENGSNACDITVKPASPVATVSINGTQTSYVDFSEAFTAALNAESATMKIMKNVSLSSSLNANEGNVTLDLNGYKITSNNQSILNLSGGTFTITDNSEGKTGAMEITNGTNTLNVTGGNLIIDGGTFSSSAYTLNISDEGTASLKGGRFKSTGGGPAIQNTSGKSILAEGYGFYNSLGEKLTEVTNSYITTAGHGPATDITVKTIPTVAEVTIGETTTSYADIQEALTAALNAESATMKMLADVTITDAIMIGSGKELTMNLNGHSLTGENIEIFDVVGGTLNLRDTESNNGKLTKGTRGVIINGGGTFNMYGGCITECKSENAGVAVYVKNGTFNMFDGVITNNQNTYTNSYKYRGVVYVDSHYGYFNMQGGSITNNSGVTYGAGVYCVAEADGSEPSENDGCLAAGTLVTMADGSKKAIESVAIGESVLTMNHDTGEMTAEPVFFIHETEMGDAFTLHFSNGTDVTVVKEHSFFEKDNNRYVTLNPQNASSYIGRSFYCAETNDWVELTTVTPIEGTVGTYALLVAHTLNHLANGMLSANEPTFPVYNAFEFGDNLIINQEKKAADIALFGTLDYEAVKDVVSAEFFDALNGKYATVLFGKGMTSMENLLRMAASYLPQNNAKQNARILAAQPNSAHVTLSGKVIISGNTMTDDDDNSSPSNLAVSEGMLSIGTLEAGSNIGIDLCISNKDEANYPITERVDGIVALNAEESDVQYFTPDNSLVAIAYNDGKLEIHHNIIKDSETFSATINYTVNTLTFERNIEKDGGKYSFIVPFDIPAAKAATLGKFYKFEKYENDVVYFIEETDVKANTAYFFDPASSITSISLNNAEVKATTSMADASNPSGYGLYGTYKKIAVPEGAYGYATSAEGDKFVRAGTGSYVNAFRCYLWLGNSDSTPAKANAIFGFDEATGINATKADYLDLNAPMYNLRGQRITSPQKGEIYIMGGKKVIFK